MMSYQDDVFSLSTLAHELGHSLHSYHTRAAQPFIYGRYGLFLAETASNFNQAMVHDYLFRTQTDRDFQIALIEEAMSNYHRYFFIMPTLARFELEAHSRAERGAPLSADILSGLTADLFAEGYGSEVAFDRERVGVTWAQFLHMYMNFYVYQYATGISAAHALSQPILAGDAAAAAGAVERYLDFLKSGGSRYPLDALRQAGVDMTSPEPVEAAFAVLAGLVERLEGFSGLLTCADQAQVSRHPRSRIEVDSDSPSARAQLRQQHPTPDGPGKTVDQAQTCAWVEDLAWIYGPKTQRLYPDDQWNAHNQHRRKKG